MEINPFTDIVPLEVATSESERKGAAFLSDVRQLSVGTGGNYTVRVTDSGIWAGAEEFSDAPFNVDMTGKVFASDITLSGGTIKYGKTSFTDSVNAGYFISPSGVYFGSASDASKLKYNIAGGTLEFTGTISASTIIGGTFKTATTGARIEINTSSYENKIALFDAVGYCGKISSTHPQLAASGIVMSSDDFVYVDLGLDTGGGVFTVGGYTAGGLEDKYIEVDFQGMYINVDIIPSIDSMYDIGSTSYCFANGYFDSITLGGSARTSWPTSFSGNLSDLTINGNKDWGGYVISNISKVNPGGATASLGDSSHFWDYFYVSSIYGAGGVNPISMENNVDFNNHNIQFVNDLDVDGNCDIQGNVDINDYCSIHGVLYMNNQQIRDVADPTAAQHAATKKWVEDNFTPL
jgi:hypothetical protein